MSASYVCGLSGENTVDPVVSKSGVVYDRKAIEAYIKKNKKCPKTGQPLTMGDLIPILNSGGSGGGGKKTTTKRMIADADTAVIDNSLIPEPVVLFASSVCSGLTSLVIFPVILFKIVEMLIFTAIPIFTGVWGLIATFQAAWVVRTLELKAVPSTVALAGSLVLLASYGVYAVGANGCSVQKARMLPFIAVLTHAALSSPLVTSPLDTVLALGGVELCTMHQLIVGSIMALALIDSRGPAVREYFESNQKASVAMAVRVHMQQ